MTVTDRGPVRTGGWGRAAALGLVVPVLFVLVWQLLATSGEFSPSQLPTPGAVAAAFVELLGRGELWRHIGISTQRVLLGFALAIVLLALLGKLTDSLLGLAERRLLHRWT